MQSQNGAGSKIGGRASDAANNVGETVCWRRDSFVSYFEARREEEQKQGKRN